MVQPVDITRFSLLFRGFTGRFGSFEIPPGQGDGKQKGIAKTLDGPITADHYAAHLRGKAGLGIIPLMDNGETACFGCIDIDKYPMDFNALENDCDNIPVVITKSKSGGAHVWLFTEEPVPARLLQETLKAWAADLGFGKHEIFPKQVRRMAPTDAGNWINLPFFGSSRKAFFNGVEQDLPSFLKYAEGRRMNEKTLLKFQADRDKVPLFNDGPPCLATITTKGIGPGCRNMVLLNVGCYYKKKDPANFLANLLEFNRKHLKEPLPESEIHNSIAKSLQRKSYGYQCTQEPLCSACNKSTCVKREFGLGGSSTELEIVLTGLTKYNTEPPIWFVNIDGTRVELKHIDSLIRQQTFRSIAAESIHVLFPVVKNSVWEKAVSELLASVEVIEAPAESSLAGQIDNEIEDFIQNFGQDESMDQIIAHTAYLNYTNDRAYFRSADMLRRLRKNLGNEVSSQKLWAHMKTHSEYDIRNVDYMMKEVGIVRLWSIALKRLQLMTHPITPPVVSGPKVPF